MASKRWSVAVTDLTGTAHLHDLAVEADNWMSALRSGRARIGEEGGVPQGASCAVSPEGVVTILDPVSRRKFVLTQRQAVAEPIQSAPSPSPIAQTASMAAPPTAAAPLHAAPAAAIPGTDPSTGKRRKFQTVAFDATTAFAAQQAPHAPSEQARFQTVAFDAKSLAAAGVTPASAVVEPSPRPRSVPPNPLAPVGSAPVVPLVPAAPAVPVFASAPAAPVQVSNEPGKRRKFQTVAFDASTMAQAAPVATAPAQAATPRAPATPIASQPATAVSAPAPVAAVAPVLAAPKPVTAPVATAPAAAPSMSPTPVSQAQLLHQRSEDPTPKNPLTYRERSFVIQGSLTRAALEATLFAELNKVKDELAAAKRGKFVNLALFDHRWQDRPLRGPVATLQWKDWKGDPELSFTPPPARASAPAPAAAVATAAHDDRLATAFEALQDLPFLSTAAEGLEFAVKLLGDLIASQAVAACLYDINTDELRIVAAAGPGSQERKTQAIPLAAGLFGQAARAGDRALVINDARHHADFDPGVDAAPGIDAHNMLLRSLVQDGQLFGVLQLINRVNGQYTNEDVNLINYISERVAGFVRQAKLRGAR